MKRFCLLIAVLFFVAADKSQDPATMKDLKDMDGVWLVSVEEISGAKTSDEQKKQLASKLTVKDGKYKVTSNDKYVTQGKVVIDATKKPKTMEATDEDGPFQDKARPAIYELTGDTMRVVFALPGRERAKEFTTQKGSGQLLLHYTREKP